MGKAARLELVLTREIGVMGKLSAAADRLKQQSVDLDKDADELMSAMDEVDRLRPIAKSRAKTYVATKKSELDGITSTLTQLTNLPLDGSEPALTDSQTVTAAEVAKLATAAPDGFPPPGGSSEHVIK